MANVVQHSLEIQIPQRNISIVEKALHERFPYREGDWFDQTVSGPRAPIGQGLAFIRLDQPLSDEQIQYLEHGKEVGLIDHYSTNEVANYTLADIIPDDTLEFDGDPFGEY